MANFRQEKISELIRRELGRIISQELETGEALITISGVDVSPNHQHATVSFTVYPFQDSEKALKRLEGRIGQIQREINKSLRMRPVPKIRFELDESEQKRRKILDLLDKTK